MIRAPYGLGFSLIGVFFGVLIGAMSLSGHTDTGELLTGFVFIAIAVVSGIIGFIMNYESTSGENTLGGGCGIPPIRPPRPRD